MSTPLVNVPLPERGKHYLRICWARAGTVEKCYSFSPQVTGWPMHWSNDRTEMCLGIGPDCAYCVGRVSLRWYGWLFGHSITHHCPCLIQLTEQSVRSSLQLRDPSCNLRGAYIELSRAASPKNARVNALVRLDNLTRGIPDGEPDVLQHLARFYKVPRPLEGRYSLNVEDDQ